jgi:hypothetical protein
VQHCLYPIPEYGKHTNASIDIMIPHYGWRMELLLEGRKIAQHIRRFDAGGAYGEWMATGDMKDYVIVNFRANRPRKVKTDRNCPALLLWYCRIQNFRFKISKVL